MMEPSSLAPSVADLCATERLSNAQRRFLAAFHQSGLQRGFYLAGGAGLSAGYLGHRSVEDLDFFGPDVVPIKRLVAMMSALPDLKSLQWLLPRDRTTFLITWSDDSQVKVEYRQFPFPEVRSPWPVGPFYIASIHDLLADKIAALTERHYPLDRIDILLILDRLKDITLDAAIDMAERKFDLVGELRINANARMAEPAQAPPASLHAPEDVEALLARWLSSRAGTS